MGKLRLVGDLRASGGVIVVGHGGELDLPLWSWCVVRASVRPATPDVVVWETKSLWVVVCWCGDEREAVADGLCVRKGPLYRVQ